MLSEEGLLRVCSAGRRKTAVTLTFTHVQISGITASLDNIGLCLCGSVAIKYSGSEVALLAQILKILVDARYKSYPDGQSAYYLAPYDLSPDKADKPMAKWEDIKSDIPAVFKGVTLDVNGKTCRVPKYEDFENLRKECDFGAGVLYGDKQCSSIITIRIEIKCSIIDIPCRCSRSSADLFSIATYPVCKGS